MNKLTDWLRQPGNRGYVYRVLGALGLVAVFYGLLSGDELGLWLAFAATVLGTGTAAVNTPTTAQLRAGQVAELAERPTGALDAPQPGRPDPGRVARRKFQR